MSGSATYMYGKEAHDEIDEPVYHITFLRGSTEIFLGRPGYIRTIHRDGDGHVTRDEENHYVHLSYGGDHCIYCGEKMGK